MYRTGVPSGPIGLRCAIELSLLGVTVHVLEARRSFSRLQVLHLWDWVELDLIDHPFYVFKNKDTGAINVIYKRNGGGVGLIEPEE